jgi:hypothetical protein
VIKQIRRLPLAPTCATLVALTLLSLIVGFSQVKTEGLGWQEANYMPRLEAVLAGEAPAPRQYRLLTDYVVVGAYRVAAFAGVPRPVGTTFVALRLLQNLALFGLAFWFYRKLGLHTYAIVLGLSALAWGMTQSNYGSDLAFNAYTDILFYLGTALFILHKRYQWIVPIAALAALNRETSALLPIMALACALPFFGATRRNRDLFRNGVIALGLFVAIQGALLLHFGLREWVVHPAGATPGLSMLQYNLGTGDAWGHGAGTLGIVPALALMGWRLWHPVLRPIFWAVVPVWFIAHLLCAPLDVSRVLLLPQVLVFVPGMLCGLTQLGVQQGSEAPGGLVA